MAKSDDEEKPVGKKAAEKESRAKPTKTSQATRRRSIFLPLALAGGGLGVLAVLFAAGGVLWWWNWDQSAPNTVAPIAQIQKLPEREKGDPEKDSNPTPATKDQISEKKPLPDEKKPVTALPDKLAPETLAKVKDATVLIHVGLLDGRPVSGSGFFVDEAGVICTNAHVLGMLEANSKPPRQIQVVIRSGEAKEQTLSAKVQAVDRDADLAIIRVEAVADKPLPQPLSLSDLPEVTETQRVFILGYPFGDSLGKQVTISESSVSSLRFNGSQIDRIQVNGGIHPGNSGGPIVDSLGNLVGVSVSIIGGTQINFAIPSQKTAGFLQTKVTSIKLGNTTMQAGKIDVPCRVDINDPLQHINAIRMQYWIGNEGPARPGGNAKPTPLADDTPIQITPLNPDLVNSLAIGKLQLQRLPTSKKVLWCQPVITTKDGKERWLHATSHIVPSVMSIRNATLTRKYVPGTEPILLKIVHTSKVLQGNEAGRTMTSVSEVHMVENIKEVGDKETKYVLYLRKTGLEKSKNGQFQLLEPNLGKTLGHAMSVSLEVRADDRGNFVELTPSFAKTAGFLDHELFTNYLAHVLRALELSSIPVNGVLLAPEQTWRSSRLPAMAAMSSPLPYSFDLVYTYHGVRSNQSGQAAVVSIDGSLRKNLDLTSGINFDGTLKGEALINLATGKVVSFDAKYHINHKVQFNAGNVNDVQDSVELHLARGPLPKETIAGLAGTWCQTQAIFNGVVQPLLPDAERWWVISPRNIQNFYYPRPRPSVSILNYKLRPDIGPNAIDFLPSDLNSTGPPSPGIFEVNGESLKICYVSGTRERPADFTSRPNSGRLLYILERIPDGAKRPPIHIAKVKKVPPSGNDEPKVTLQIESSNLPVLPCIDLSTGLTVAHTFRFSERAIWPNISPDGKLIACCVGQEILLIDVLSRKTLVKVNEDKVCRHVFSQDCKLLASLSTEEGKLTVREVPSLKELHRFSRPTAFNMTSQLAFSPGGRYLISLDSGKELLVWDLQAGKQVGQLARTWRKFELAPDGKQIMVFEKDSLILLDFATLSVAQTLKSPFGPFRDAAFSADNKHIYVMWTSKFEAWDRKTGKKEMSYNIKSSAPSGIWASADNQFLIGGTGLKGLANSAIYRVDKSDPITDTFVRDFQAISHTGRAVMAQNTTEVYLYCVKSDPAFLGTTVAAKDDTNKIPAIDAISRFRAKLTLSPSAFLAGLTFSADDRFVACAATENSVIIFDAKTGNVIKTLPTKFTTLSGMVLNKDGSTIFVTGGVGQFNPFQRPANPSFISKINIASGKEERLSDVLGVFFHLKLSPDGSRLYAIGSERSLQVWDANTGKSLHSWDNLFRPPSGLELSRDGKKGILVMDDGPIVLNLENFRDGLKFPEGTRNMRLIGDTGRAAMASKNKILKIWDLNSGNLVKSVDLIERDSNKSFGIARVSPDGRFLYISGTHVAPDLYHVLDAETLKPVLRYRLESLNGSNMFSPSGNLMALRTNSELHVVELPPMTKK